MTFVVGGIVGPLLVGVAVWGLSGPAAGLTVGGLMLLLSGLGQLIFTRGDSESWINRTIRY